MTKPNDRTHLEPGTARLSDVTIRSLDSQTQRGFGKWAPRFSERICTRERAAAWNTLEEAGCLHEDLVWAFYWAIDSIDTATDVPNRLRAFRRDSIEVLREIHRRCRFTLTILETRWSSCLVDRCC